MKSLDQSLFSASSITFISSTFSSSTFFTLIAALFLSSSLARASTTTVNVNRAQIASEKAFQALLASSHVVATNIQDPSAKPTRLSSLLKNMLTVSTQDATYLVISTQTCEPDAAPSVVRCALHILSSDRKIDLSPAENMTESSIVIEYKVNVKTQGLVGQPSFFIAG